MSSQLILRCMMDNAFRIKFYGENCIYCGMGDESWEHWPPRSFTHRGMLLPCCLECNCMAGARSPINFRDRVKIVKDGIRTKYKKALKMPNWDDEELEEMSYSMRCDIQKWKTIKEKVNYRLAWNAEVYLSKIANGKDFAAILAECDLITTNGKESFLTFEQRQQRKEFEYDFLHI